MTNTFVTITLAAVHVPASSNGAHAPGTHIVGFALFIAEQDDAGHWKFAQRAEVIAAGTSEATLLAWIAGRLPHDCTVIGWHIDDRLVPALLDAASAADAAVAQRFLRSLHRLLNGCVVDVALGCGSDGKPLTEVAADMAIFSPDLSEEKVFSAWATGDVARLRRELANEAIAIWRCWLRLGGVVAIDVEEATDGWLARRSVIRAVGDVNGPSGLARPSSDSH